LESIEDATRKYNLTSGEAALRWLKYHSQLSKLWDDAITIGASSIKHLESNLAGLERGPLPVQVVQALENAWSLVKGVAPAYWH